MTKNFLTFQRRIYQISASCCAEGKVAVSLKGNQKSTMWKQLLKVLNEKHNYANISIDTCLNELLLHYK